MTLSDSSKPGAYQRAGWVILLVLSILLAVNSLFFGLVGVTPAIFETDTGVAWGEFSGAYPTVATLLDLAERLNGSGYFGTALFTAIITFYGLRKGIRWTWMVDQGFWSLQRTMGAFLVLGFGTMLVGALMFVNRGGSQENIVQNSAYFVWEWSLIMAAVILTAIGLILFESILHDAGDRVLARIGATAYLFGAVLLVAGEAIGLPQGDEFYPLIVIYVVLAFLAQAAIGGALLHTGLLPIWVGWTTIVWNIGWLIILPLLSPGDIYFPVLHHLMPLLIGFLLLLRSFARVAA